VVVLTITPKKALAILVDAAGREIQRLAPDGNLYDWGVALNRNAQRASERRAEIREAIRVLRGIIRES
jgi:hypothetical protein